ncbi:retropepsin-like aspartic protease family protein [Roseibium sp. LAB1]
MSRFVIIFLACMAIAPLAAYLLENRLAVLVSGGNVAGDQAEEDDGDTGERSHRISANRQGHFVADAYLNGRAVDMLVDTGATVTVLPESLAENIGIFVKSSDYKYSIRTANGTVHGARAVIDNLRIGKIRLRNIDTLVLKDQSLGEPLLGMSVLNQLKRFDISGGTLVLVQ